MSDPRLRIILLGTGSSGGVPRIDGNWGVCDPAEPRNRRLRCSALVEQVSQSGTTRVLIDTSPDLREQILAVGVTALDGIVFTHDHADQTHGIDDVRALVLARMRRIPVWMDAPTAATLLTRFGYCFEGKGGYPAILERQEDISPFKAFSVDGPGGAISFLPLAQEHGNIPSLGFRLGDLAYCNDLHAFPTRTLEHLTGLDTLILDALRYKPHPSHAHVELALSWVKALKPRRTVFTNMHIDLDYQTLRHELPAGVEPGYDGMIIGEPNA